MTAVGVATDAHEFLPAALEIQATPPSPLGRGIVWTIVALFSATVLWACLGHIDIVAVARGKVVPTGGVKAIQPLGISTVRAIHVKNGQAVKAGQVLIELDPTLATAERDRLVTELTAIRAELGRLRDLLAAASSGTAVHSKVVPRSDGLSLQLDLLSESYRAYEADLSALEQTIERAAADQRRAAGQVAKLVAILPLVTERTEAYRKLASDNLVSRNQLLELEQKRIEIENDLVSQTAASQSAQAERVGLNAQRSRLIADFRTKALTRIEVLQGREASLAQEVIKAERIQSQQTLVAPVDGVVQQLEIHTVGGVVTPAQQLMVVVPRDSRLEVEAYVENKDIGFVASKQLVEVKVDSFPFTRYGTIDGEIMTLSDDAVKIENVGLVYAATVSLAKSVLSVDGRNVPLSPGMTVTVEVKTGKRRLIEFLLAPLLKAGSESGRER